LIVSEVGSGPKQDTSVAYEITDGHCVSPLGSLTKRNDPEETCKTKERRTRRVLEGTIWQRIAQDRHMWTQPAESFTPTLRMHIDDDDNDDETSLTNFTILTEDFVLRPIGGR